MVELSTSFKVKAYHISCVTDAPEGEEDGLPETPGCGGYILHFFTLFWKILFAFVPPAGECVKVCVRVPACGVVSQLAVRVRLCVGFVARYIAPRSHGTNFK